MLHETKKRISRAIIKELAAVKSDCEQLRAAEQYTYTSEGVLYLRERVKDMDQVMMEMCEVFDEVMAKPSQE